MIKKQGKLPTLIGIIFLVLGTFLGVVALNYQQVFRLGAEGEASPKDIRVSNISDNSVTVSWITDVPTIGAVLYGTSELNMNQSASESLNDDKKLTHSINLNGLKDNTTYFYKINSNGQDFDNQGIPWQLKTGANIGINDSSFLISGSVITATGQPVEEALVYVNVSGYLLSTITSSTGNFVVQLSNTRTSDLDTFQILDNNTMLLEMFIEKSSTEASTLQVYPKSANPIPVIILGNSYDHRNLDANSSSEDPNAFLNAPQNQDLEVVSKLVVEDSSVKASEKTVTLESVEEKEIISSDQPEFSGTGPTGEEITITVESENPMTGNVTIGSSGGWKWSPPDSLAAGSHKVTITWIDASGITRKLIRNFEVQASEVVPAFEASSSGQVASPTPTTSAATPSATNTSTPKATTTGSAAPVPQTASLIPTYFMFIIGSAMFLFSFAVWRFSEHEY